MARRTDAEANAAWVSGAPRLDGAITLADYDPDWPALASRTWAYVQHYANAKSEVVEAIIARGLASEG